MSVARTDTPRPGRASDGDGGGGGRSTLRVIAAMKFLEAALLIAAGLGALGLLREDWQHALIEWLHQTSLHEGRRLTSALTSRTLDVLGATTIGRLMLISLGCFIYGAVHLVEGTGLWLRKRWAEYVTILVTASFLPFEIIELMHGPSPTKIATMTINIAVVAYLIRRLVTQREHG